MLHKLGIWETLIRSFPRLFKRPLLTVFTYHRISHNSKDSKYIMPYERGHSVQTFEKHIHWMSKCFEFIDLDKFIEIIYTRKAKNKAYALLTFDDGDSEFEYAALPILKKYDIPAVIFVPTHFLDTGKIFYNLRLTSLIDDIDNNGWRKIAETEMPQKVRTVIEDYQERWSSCKKELRREIGLIFFGMKEIEVEQILDRWENLTGHNYSLGIKSIDWDEARELERQGVRIQSHTVNHYRLDGLDDDEIEFELAESKRRLESELDHEALSICYPVGAYDERVVELSRRVGYKLGFTTDPGIIDLTRQGDYCYKLPRISNGISGTSTDYIDLGYSLYNAILNNLRKNQNNREHDENRKTGKNLML